MRFSRKVIFTVDEKESVVVKIVMIFYGVSAISHGMLYTSISNSHTNFVGRYHNLLIS